MCPGTAAGTFDPGRHSFVNLDYNEVMRDLMASISLMRSVNPGLRVMLTVSPVPLTATASGKHVLVATTYSKSVLRACAADACGKLEDVDYFPSYEIISSAPFRGFFFEPNMRSVSPGGVSFVMKSFISSLPAEAQEEEEPMGKLRRRKARSRRWREEARRSDDVACEEEMLAAFGTEQ